MEYNLVVTYESGEQVSVTSDSIKAVVQAFDLASSSNLNTTLEEL
jgi:hypothetical protein